MPYYSRNRHVNDDDAYVRILKEIERLERIGSPRSQTKVLEGAGLYGYPRGTRTLGKMVGAGLIEIRDGERRHGSIDVYMTPFGKEYLESHQRKLSKETMV